MPKKRTSTFDAVNTNKCKRPATYCNELAYIVYAGIRITLFKHKHTHTHTHAYYSDYIAKIN